MTIYDIREQTSPKNYILLFVGILMIPAALMFLLRVIMYFSGTRRMDIIGLVLDAFGIFASVLIAYVLISLSVNTTKDFREYRKQIEQNSCLTVTGHPEDFKIYNIRSEDGDLLRFEVDGVYFDTDNLFRTKKGLSEEDIKMIQEADEITVKYVKSKAYSGNETYNFILLIEVNNSE